MHTSPTAIVTGASRGIGQAIAQRLAADGYAVIINYASDRQSAEQTVAEIRAAGGDAFAFQADVSQTDEVRALFAYATQTCGQVQVVVNNAGVMTTAPICTDSLEALDRALQINLRGTYNMMALAGEYLRDNGRFIAISSSVLGKNFPGYGSYIASKSGVEGLVRVFANELRGRNITVNAIAPGPVATELFFEGKTEQQVENIINMAPLQRIGQPEDIAAAVAFLAGKDGAWINGQVLRANGGFV